MKQVKVIIRFDEVHQSDKYPLRRIFGTATPDSVVRLIDVADLQANPREAKMGDVTDDIRESLSKTPHLFQFKTKGLLLASGGSKPLERNRFEVSFEDPEIEGILDGGHNLLAIAYHILEIALNGDSEVLRRRIKRWEDVPDLWKENRDKIEELRTNLNFLTPVEIIFPQEGPAGTDEFQFAVLDVAKARNNNAQLTEETKANKAGYYDSIREAIDPELKEQVEWKANDGGRIKVRDLIALAWIPLSKIDEDLAGKKAFSPVQMYSSKGNCVSLFNDLVEDKNVSEERKGQIREIMHKGVKSALKVMGDLPNLFDLIYREFPGAYNKFGDFGRIGSVRIWSESKKNSESEKHLKRPPKTKFYREECTYDYPEGFIIPLMWGLAELMEYHHGEVRWKPSVNPAKFIEANLKKTLEVYYGMIQLSDYDPQKVGKTAACYNLIANDFRSRVREL